MNPQYSTEYFAREGARGSRSRSPAKIAAVNRNLAKASAAKAAKKKAILDAVFTPLEPKPARKI